jgi:hypothetical protein
MRTTLIAALTLTTLLLAPSAQIRADTADVATLVEQISSGDQAARKAAARKLRKLGPPALKALHAAKLKASDEAQKARLTRLLDRILKRRAAKLLPKRRGRAGNKIRYTLTTRSELLPFLRCYRARGTRYPEALILDLLAGEELAKLDAETLNLQLKQSGAACRSRKAAKQVAALYIELHYQPYEARQVKLKLRRRGRRGHQITAQFLRTIPWSGGQGPSAAVRSRTVVRKVMLAVSRGCRVRVKSDNIAKVVYSGGGK